MLPRQWPAARVNVSCAAVVTHSFTYRLGGRGGEERGEVTKKSEGGWEIGEDLDKALKMKKAGKGTEEGRERNKKKQRKDEGRERRARNTEHV